MLPLESSSVSGSSAHPTVGGGAPPRARPRGVAVSGGSYRDPLLPQQQQHSVQQYQPQQLLKQVIDVSPVDATRGVVQRSSSSVSRGDSAQLLDTASKRAAMVSYPSAGEVLLRHGSSKYMPVFRPRPQPGVQAVTAGVTAADVTPAAYVHSSVPGSRITAASPGAPGVSGAGQYISIPVKSTTAGHMQKVYTQNVYPPVIQQGGHQWPLVSQQQQAVGQPYPAHPLLYAQHQQQSQRWQQQQLQQGQPTQGRQLPAQYYTGPSAGRQLPLQQQHSLPTFPKDTKRADGEPRFLKSALRSYASSNIVDFSRPCNLKNSPSVRFALDEDEVFQKEEGNSQGTSEGGAVIFRSREAPHTAGYEAVEVEPSAKTAPTATTPPASGSKSPLLRAPAGDKGELTVEKGTVAIDTSATPPPSARLTGPLVREALAGIATSTQQAARGTVPGAVFAVEKIPLAAPIEQQGKGAGNVVGGGLGGTDERDQALKYQPVPPSEGKHEAEPLGKMIANTGPQPILNGTSVAFQEQKNRLAVEKSRGNPTLTEKAPTRDPTAAANTGYPAFAPQREVKQQAQEYRRAGEHEQHADQPKKEDAGKQSQHTSQSVQQGVGQQQTVSLEHKPEQGLRGEKTQGSEAELTAACVPCLWIGHGDRPHVCLNFSASFQPKLLVRRSSAPAVHVYGDERMPVEIYFKAREAIAGRPTATTPSKLAPFAVEQTALTAAITAGSKVKPGVTAGAQTKVSPSQQEEREMLLKEKITKPQVVKEPEEQKSSERELRHKAEEELAASTDPASIPAPSDNSTAKAAEEAAGGGTEGGGDLSADIPAGSVTRVEGTETHGVSRRDWSILGSLISSSAPLPRLFPFEIPEKRVSVVSRRDSNVSTSDSLSADEAEWRLEMARPTILFHWSFHSKDKQQQMLAAAGGSATATQADGAETQRLLIVVDTTSEWWPSVQIRWVDGKKPMQALEQQLRDEPGAQGPLEARESTQAGAPNAESERLICRGHPTNLAGICIWSNYRPTLLDLRS